MSSRDALGVYNLRLYVAGQGLSLIGTFFQVVALSLFVLELTGSGFALGAIMGAQAIPVLLLGPWAGVLVDRLELRRVLVATSSLAGLQALAIGLLITVGWINIWWILGLSMFVGLVQTLAEPAGQAFLSQLVDGERLPSAIAFSAAIRSVGRLGGPAVAAVLYAAAGPEWCFFVNGVSYLAVVASVVLLRTGEMVPRVPVARARGQLVAGLRFAWSSPLHRSPLMCNAIIGCLAFNFPLFYASIVRETFHRGAVEFGVAESINAVTALLAGLALARFGLPTSMRTYAFGCLALGTSLAWSALSPTLWIFLGGMLYFGAAAVVYQTAGQSLVQRYAPPEMTGRIVSLYNLGTMGTTPVGALIAGLLIDAVSPRAAIGLGAASCLVCGLVLLTLRTGERPDKATLAGEFK
jgi:MFS family permease